MLSDDATTVVKALISPGEREAARDTVERWPPQQKADALVDLIKNINIAQIFPKPIVGEKGTDKDFILGVYLAGIVVWALIWIILASIEGITHLGLFGGRRNIGLFLAFLIPPMVVGFFALFSNAFLLRDGSSSAGYENEVKAIDFLERHASFFLVGSSAVFFFASFSFRDLGLGFSFPAFVIYETLSLICLSTVLLLYWFPHEGGEARSLIKMRHLKTIPFTFAVSFFLAALMTITTAALPVVVP